MCILIPEGRVSVRHVSILILPSLGHYHSVQGGHNCRYFAGTFCNYSPNIPGGRNIFQFTQKVFPWPWVRSWGICMACLPTVPALPILPSSLTCKDTPSTLIFTGFKQSCATIWELWFSQLLTSMVKAPDRMGAKVAYSLYVVDFKCCMIYFQLP